MEVSLKRIESSQLATGGFLASEDFADYKYCWFRDGSFVAHACTVAGKKDSALRFLRWARGTILDHEYKVTTLLQALAKDHWAAPSCYLDARYTDRGREVPGEWGSFQLDGHGTFLWALAEFFQAFGTSSLDEFRSSAELCITYLTNVWRVPCNDCWEENGQLLHTATLAAIYGGLHSIAAYFPDSRIAPTCDDIKSFVECHCVKDGRFVKSVTTDGNVAIDSVDASLMWLLYPFGMFTAQDKRMLNTVSAIESSLAPHFPGVHRYPYDNYYGGGEWILLSAWLGITYAQVGQQPKACQVLQWIRTQLQNFSGDLPEQLITDDAVFNTGSRDDWVSRKGNPARNLMWSHAMHVILSTVLGQ
eukprot:m51a1_g3315 hypothetical protein (361) ;mRNA; f:343103-344512